MGKSTDQGSGKWRGKQLGKRPIGYSSNDDDNDGDDNQCPTRSCRTRFAARTAMTNDAVRPLNWYHLLIGTSNFYRSVYRLSRDKIIARRACRPMLLRPRNDSHAVWQFRECVTAMINVAIPRWSLGRMDFANVLACAFWRGVPLAEFAHRWRVCSFYLRKQRRGGRRWETKFIYNTLIAIVSIIWKRLLQNLHNITCVTDSSTFCNFLKECSSEIFLNVTIYFIYFYLMVCLLI